MRTVSSPTPPFAYDGFSPIVNARPKIVAILCLFMALALAVIAPANVLAAGSDPVRIVALGDSLTAGYGVAQPAAFPVRLERALRDRGMNVRVINAGVSGDTTAGGLSRIDWTLATGADAVIIELGANDGLRGLDPKVTRDNLAALIGRIKAHGLPILLTGMRAPPNFGPDYGAEFNGLFSALATQHEVLFYPFFLDGVAAQPKFNQADGIHPTAKGVDVIVSKILPHVVELVRQTKK